MSYRDDDLLLLSGIQHFAFCRRQWALIHVEGQWKENLRTTLGEIVHARAHDGTQTESRGNTIVTRGLRVSSYTMDVVGQCDVVEFYRCSEGAVLEGHTGYWQPYPIEYKKGRPKDYPADEMQLCAEGMCLEEMLCCTIPEGALFYAEIHRRQVVPFSEELRHSVRESFQEMHRYLQEGRTPRVKPQKHCNACSLKPICLPRNYKQRDISDYYATMLGGEN